MSAHDGTFWDLVERTARARPEDRLVCDADGNTLSTAAFRDRAEACAAGLVDLGLGPGDVLTWQLPTTLEAVVLMAACARLGVVQNPVIPVLRDEVAFIVDQLDPVLVVVPERWKGFDHGVYVRGLGRRALALDLDDRPADGRSAVVRLPAGDPATLPAPPADRDACRWVYYSSGTTAAPKGVRHSDRSVLASSNGVVHGLGLGEGDLYPIAWPISHIGGVAMLSAALRGGGALSLFDTFDPATTPGRMAAQDPTILGSATPFFHAYVAAQRARGDEPLFPRLRTCVGGGAPTPGAVNDEVRRVLGVSGVVGTWGLTEFPVATSESPADPDVGTTVGAPTEGVRVRVVDGELRLKGPPCFQGYVDGSLDRDAFDEDGWFRTGDLGSVDERGRIRIEGRSKDVIIRNAENVSATEVEEVLARHPAVADVAVVGVPHERIGEQVCAVVVAAPGRSLVLADLVEHCRAAGLARYKAPERLMLVEELPRNQMGKVLKRSIHVV